MKDEPLRKKRNTQVRQSKPRSHCCETTLETGFINQVGSLHPAPDPAYYRRRVGGKTFQVGPWKNAKANCRGSSKVCYCSTLARTTNPGQLKLGNYSLALRGSCAQPGILLKLSGRTSIACEGRLLACPFQTISACWFRTVGKKERPCTCLDSIRMQVIVWATPEWECLLEISWPSSKEAP